MSRFKQSLISLSGQKVTGHALRFSPFSFHPAGPRCVARPCVVPTRPARRI